jgi:FKBP-type peptidyl-prolyl cis-trans isomerase
MKNKLLVGLSVAALSVIGLAATTVMTNPTPTGKDYTTLPVKPDVMAKSLASATTSMTQAIAAAEAATAGHASSASVESGQYVVDTFGETGHSRVIVSMATGKVASNEKLQWIEQGEAVTTDWTTTDSGLMYAEIVEGTGETPANSSARVTVHYSGWLLDGSKFDSSVDRGQPATFPLNGVIAGWTEGVGSMKIGGKRKLVIPFDLAYGAAGRPPVIPAKATLVFDVELLSIN